MKRLAALIHFHENVTEEEARAALESIANVLDRPVFYGSNGFTDGDAGDYVREYDDYYGGPVWYIP